MSEREIQQLDDLLAMGFIQEDEYRRRRAEIGAPVADPAGGSGNRPVDPPVNPDPYITPYTPYDPPIATNPYDMPVVEPPRPVTPPIALNRSYNIPVTPTHDDGHEVSYTPSGGRYAFQPVADAFAPSLRSSGLHGHAAASNSSQTAKTSSSGEESYAHIFVDKSPNADDIFNFDLPGGQGIIVMYRSREGFSKSSVLPAGSTYLSDVIKYFGAHSESYLVGISLKSEIRGSQQAIPSGVYSLRSPPTVKYAGVPCTGTDFTKVSTYVPPMNQLYNVAHPLNTILVLFPHPSLRGQQKAVVVPSVSGIRDAPTLRRSNAQYSVPSSGRPSVVSVTVPAKSYHRSYQDFRVEDSEYTAKHVETDTPSWMAHVDRFRSLERSLDFRGNDRPALSNAEITSRFKSKPEAESLFYDFVVFFRHVQEKAVSYAQKFGLQVPVTKIHKRFDINNIKEALANGKCIFTGQPAKAGSFLAPALHSDALVALYHKWIKLYSSVLPVPGPYKEDDWEIESRVVVEPRKAYDTDTPKWTYFDPKAPLSISLRSQPAIASLASQCLGKAHVDKQKLVNTLNGVKEMPIQKDNHRYSPLRSSAKITMAASGGRAGLRSSGDQLRTSSGSSGRQNLRRSGFAPQLWDENEGSSNW